MNLLFRLLCVLVFSRGRKSLGVFEECRTLFRVAPTDLDLLRHMNNGKYFSLQDLARLELMIRTGVGSAIAQRGWYPVIASETLRFKKSLKLFDRFEIVTRILSWDEKCFYLEHHFVRGNEIVANGLVRARFLKRAGGGVSPREGMAAMGVTTPPPVFPNYLTEWIASEIDHAKALPA